MNELMMIESDIEMLKDYIAKCRKNKKRISMDTVKWYAGSIYDLAEQKRQFDKGLLIGRVGVDFIDHHCGKQED